MDYEHMSIAELETLRDELTDIIWKKQVVAAAPGQVEQIQRSVLDAEGREMCAPWQQPAGAHDSYPSGWVVEHEGRFWRNDHVSGNAWEPGEVGTPWIEVWPADDGGWTDQRPENTDPDTGEVVPPAWQVGMTIQPGDRVEHDGQTWEALLAHTTHEGWIPSPHTHAVWKPVE